MSEENDGAAVRFFPPGIPILAVAAGYALDRWLPIDFGWSLSTPQIEERGPFAVTRNPMYLQMVLVCLGVGIASMSWWTIASTPLVAWLLWVLAIKPEEAYLTKKFGDAYLSYKARVRRWV